MRFSHPAAALGLVGSAMAQGLTSYTNKDEISFYQASFDTGAGTGQWGMALPAATQTDYKEEYIGNIVAPNSEEAWFGMVHLSGMTNSLILVTWLEGETIHTSFRFATGYTAPDIYTGDAVLTPISQTINTTHYELTYRCQNCWSWDQDGATDSQIPATTASAAQIMGWAQATTAPTDPTDDDSAIKQHQGSGIFGCDVGKARNAKYTDWIKLATAAPAPTGSYGGGNGTSASATGSATASATTAPATSAPCPTSNPVVNQTWDYIVVGAGAGGIPLADKLSEDGASVLLVERGPPSTGRWGGTMKPGWLNGTDLTRFDVPGLDNQIWADADGIACTDYSVMAGCVLGGGTAVNAGLWWKANPSDFDYNFPEGWKHADVEDAIERVFERIPFTDRPSMDGVLYKPQGYEVVAGALAASGWDNVTADLSPAEKNYTFSHPNHMFHGGERSGPLATYLVTADARTNFKLVHSTTVNRVVRTGGKITGVELEAFLPGGQCGVAKVKSTGKVILSAGAFGTPKILFRSGIGPADQLAIVAKAEGTSMIEKADWINLPVGYNLDDHTNTDVVIEHPDVEFYDFYAAYDKPITADKDKYLQDRSGILAQSAPNLATVFWQEITGADGIVRQLQWTARVEGGHDITSKKAMVISQYLGRGKTSRGRATINSALNMVVSKMPYINDQYDLAAITEGIESLKQNLASDQNIKIVYPPSNTTTKAWLDAYPITTGARSANHWLGSCKMGVDSGLKNNGSSVVDLNTKVYGTDNLFVVDASIFPGMVSTNPSALIVAAAEHAAPLIAKAPVSGSSSYPVSGATNGTASGYPLPAGSSAVPPPNANGTATSTRCTTLVTLSRSASAGFSSAYSVAPVGSTNGAGFPSQLSSDALPSASASAPSYGSVPTYGSAPTPSASASSSPVSPVETSQPSYPGNDSPSASVPYDTGAPSSPASPIESSAPPAGPGSSTSCVQTVTLSKSSGAPGATSYPIPGNSTIPAPAGSGVGTAYPTATLPAYGGGAPGAAVGAIAKWQRCGGLGVEITDTCGEGLVCKKWNDYYSQCVDAADAKKL